MKQERPAPPPLENELGRLARELEAARAEAENARRRLAAILEALPVGVAITDLQGGTILANESYERAWGAPLPETKSVADYAAYQAWRADSGEPVAPEEWASAQAVRKGQTVIGQMFRIRRFDGTHRYILNSASPIRDAGGEVTGSAVAIQDITELRQAELALREAHAKAAWLARFPEENPNPVICCAADGTALYCNPASARLPGWACRVGERLPEPLPAIVRRALASDQAIEEDAAIGGRFYSINAARVAGEEYANLYGRDVTGRWQAEEDLRATAQELVRSNRDLEQFAYVASHDLQEPLRMVGSFVQLLGDRYRERLDGAAVEYVDYAVEGVQRMQRLIDDLLAYARVGHRGRAPAPVDAQGAFEQSLEVLRACLDEAGARIAHEPLPTVWADGGQLAQVFQNLIANSVKFRDPARPLEIHVGARREGKDWLFRVRDNGIGFDPVYAERVFVIFQRLHTRDDYPGTGMGLAICKKIVEWHGGRIWVESRPGEGSTFFFTLPAASEEER